MYILGLNLSHDRSACLLKDGRIVVAIAEERLDGSKRSTLYSRVRKKDQSSRVPPFRSISYCLGSEGIGIDDVDLIIADHAIEPVNTGSLQALLPVRDKSKIRSIPHPSHHLAHAYSAFFCSPFEEAAILVADTFGSETRSGTEAESGFHARGNSTKALLKNYQSLWSEKHPNRRVYYSLTYIYNFISLALGFTGKASHEIAVSEAGKTMGLASYGRPRPEWPAIVEFHNGRIETDEFTQWALDRKIARVRKGALVPVPKSKNAKLAQYHMDLAYAAQAELEKGMIFLANRLHEMTGSKNLCIAGGAGLNSIANKKILDETPFENISIQPASTDDGTAIGCALYGWHELARQNCRYPLKHVYLGAPYKEEQVRGTLCKRQISKTVLSETELIRQTAQHLAAGKIVGWFQGAAEFGPRALGHRSILADPRRAGMKELINRKVKHRESFRPYAPSILLEFAGDYFFLTCPSPYMLLVAKAKAERASEIPAVIHVDGTARVQTVTQADNGVFWALLTDFHRLTGVPVLLNTSFNTKGMPIVETPEDALNLFFDSEMDVLVLDRFICDKNEKETMMGLAAYHEENKALDKALRVTRMAVKRFPEEPCFLPRLAKYHYENKNYREAIDASERALSLDSREDGVNLHAILGKSYEKVGEFLKAVPELKKAETIDPEDEKISASLVRCYRETSESELMNRELARGFKIVRDRSRGFN
jgi:carbamoyltransferase